MGEYLNPGNEGFQQALNGKYIDKTGMISLINDVLNTPDKLTCISRPRRFGKTFAVKMLCAYYDKSCDSRQMFQGLEIAKSASFDKYLNKFDVIYLDITRFLSQMRTQAEVQGISRSEAMKHIVSDIQREVIHELKCAYPGCISDDIVFLPNVLSEIYRSTGDRFFIVIDEWDALFREAKKDIEVQESYLEFLRGLFKGGISSDKTIVGAYMTGILPIKKYGTESALTDFHEYTMVNPNKFAQYVGFTEAEVRELCQQYHMEFDLMEQWYDGYSFSRVKHVYCPNSVMGAIRNEEFASYWTQSETYESLKDYITMNRDGLKDAIISMLGDEKVRINPLKFQNDLTNMDTRDKVLTLLVHLGYLSYDGMKKTVHIPNLEVAEAFMLAVEDTGWDEIGDALEKSADLLEQTLAGNSEYVAEALEEFHQQNTSILKYNDENALSCVLAIAYYTARSDYEIIRELPAGKGFADMAFLPRRHSDKPAMIIELKYNKSAKTALQQIKDKNYAGAFKDYEGNMLLVGINYDEKKGHTCVIEKYTKKQ